MALSLKSWAIFPSQTASSLGIANREPGSLRKRQKGCDNLATAFCRHNRSLLVNQRASDPPFGLHRTVARMFNNGSPPGTFTIHSSFTRRHVSALRVASVLRRFEGIT